MEQFDLFLVLFSILSFAISASAADPQCKFPNGTALPNVGTWKSFRPCGFAPVHTICCATHNPNTPGGNLSFGRTQDECLPNGLCQNRAVTPQGVSYINWWVSYCTESGYESDQCLNFCKEQREQTDGARVTVTPCDDTILSEFWCCGKRKDCCQDEKERFKLPKVFGTSQISSISNSTTAPTAKTTASTTAVAHSMSQGAKIGIGAGIAATSVALAGVALFAFRALSWRRRLKKAMKNTINTTPELPDCEQNRTGCRSEKRYRYAGFTPRELPSERTSVIELPDQTMHELPGFVPRAQPRPGSRPGSRQAPADRQRSVSSVEEQVNNEGRMPT